MMPEREVGWVSCFGGSMRKGGKALELGVLQEEQLNPARKKMSAA